MLEHDHDVKAGGESEKLIESEQAERKTTSPTKRESGESRVQRRRNRQKPNTKEDIARAKKKRERA
jgi:hypothetical protein